MLRSSIKHRQIACMNLLYRNYSLEYFFDSVERIGFETIAFWAGPPHFNLDAVKYDDAKRLRKKLVQQGLSCTSFTAAALLPPYQFAIEGPEQIEDCYRYFTNGVRVAADLGAHVMSVNSGYGMKDRSRDDAWKRSCDLLRCVSEFALKYGVCLTLESLRPLETNLVSTIDETKRMIDEIHHSNLKAMVDTTAISVSGETLWDWFRNFKKDIKNLHFVDGSPNGHLAWGDGILELDDMICCLSEYGYEGPLGLEITDQRYMNDPSSAMEKSYNNLVRYVDD